MSGMWMSEISRSTGRRSSSASACWPFSATTTSKPSRPSTIASSSRIDRSSSTTRRRPLGRGGAARRRRAARAAARSRHGRQAASRRAGRGRALRPGRAVTCSRCEPGEVSNALIARRSTPPPPPVAVGQPYLDHRALAELRRDVNRRRRARSRCGARWPGPSPAPLAKPPWNGWKMRSRSSARDADALVGDGRAPPSGEPSSPRSR